MLFTKARVSPGQTILIQSSSGGMSTALIQLGAAASVRVWCTGRSYEKRNIAILLEADQVFSPGETLPYQVDAVFDASEKATWDHSMHSLKTGVCIVTCGAHGGFHASLDLLRVFNDQISIYGVHAGT